VSALTNDEIRARIDAISVWRHRIDLGSTITPGTEDCQMELRRLQIPTDLTGRRVLDVGCSDGFFSFECERRGATVVAIDDESSLLAGGVNGFQTAAQILDSGVEYRTADVELLPDADASTFDLVLFINVLYHLRNPMKSLEQLAAVTKPGGTLILKTYFQSDVRFWLKGKCYGFDVDRRPKWWYFPATELAGDPTNWWAPNRAGLEAMLGATGWTGLHRLGTFGDRLYYRATRAAG